MVSSFGWVNWFFAGRFEAGTEVLVLSGCGKAAGLSCGVPQVHVHVHVHML